jgi:hypothetical protein
MNRNTITIALAMAAMSGCGKPKTTTVSVTDSIPPAVAPGSDTALHPVTPPETVFVDRTRRPPPPRPSRPPRPAPPPVAVAEPPAPLPVRSRGVLPAGTTIAATAIDSITSRRNRVGDRMRIRVSDDVTANGRVVIPAGSVINLSVVEIDNAIERNHKGTLSLGVRDIEIDDVSHPIGARITNFRYEMIGRGVGAAEVAKTGAGAVIGGIIGNAIGGKVGTVVGVVGGAAGGAAVARKTADYDIVIHAGAPVTLELTDAFRKG